MKQKLRFYQFIILLIVNLLYTNTTEATTIEKSASGGESPQESKLKSEEPNPTTNEKDVEKSKNTTFMKNPAEKDIKPIIEEKQQIPDKKIKEVKDQIVFDPRDAYKFEITVIGGNKKGSSESEPSKQKIKAKNEDDKPDNIELNFHLYESRTKKDTNGKLDLKKIEKILPIINAQTEQITNSGCFIARAIFGGYNNSETIHVCKTSQFKDKDKITIELTDKGKLIVTIDGDAKEVNCTSKSALDIRDKILSAKINSPVAAAA